MSVLSEATPKISPLQRPRRRRQSRHNLKPEVASLIVGWRQLAPEELAERILAIQRVAADRHLSEDVWTVVDRMRRVAAR